MVDFQKYHSYLPSTNFSVPRSELPPPALLRPPTEHASNQTSELNSIKYMRSIYARIGTVLALVCTGAVSLCAAPLIGEDAQNHSKLLRQAPHFHANGGQWDEAARFLCELPGMALWVGDHELVFDRLIERSVEAHHTSHVLRMHFAGASPVAKARALTSAHSRRTYLGADAAIYSAAYTSVQIDALYPGIDLVLQVQDFNPRYDFHLRAGADPKVIQLAYKGVDSLAIQGETSLVLYSAHGNLLHRNLLAYQISADGERQIIECRFKKLGEKLVGFELGDYDSSKPLVIDPLVYSTYIGGYGIDRPTDIALHNNRLYMTGETCSREFPDESGTVSGKRRSNDVFVARLSPNGDAIEASTILGGQRSDAARALTVLPDGRVVVVGWTESDDFPVNKGQALQDDYSVLGSRAGFIVLLNEDLESIIHATYYGGAGRDVIEDVKSVGDVVYCVGSSNSQGLPGIASGAYQSVNSGLTDAFYTRFIIRSGPGPDETFISDPRGTFIGSSNLDRAKTLHLFGNSVYIGGETRSSNFVTSPSAIQVDWQGGTDMFFASISSDARTLEYSTVYGGPNDESVEAIGVFSDGSIILGGNNTGGEFRLSPNAYSTQGSNDSNPVIVKFKIGLGSVDYASYMGLRNPGVDNAEFVDLAIDGDENVILVGNTTATAFDVTDNAEYPDFGGGSLDAWTIMIAPGNDINVFYSSYFGGSQTDAAAAVVSSGNGRFYLAGSTTSPGPTFPTTAEAFSRNKIDPLLQDEVDAFAALITLGPEIVYPNGGEILCSKSGVTIRWEGIFREEKISLVLLNETTGDLIAIKTDLDANIGSYTWEVPEVEFPEHDYRIVILGSDNRRLERSDAAFNIFTPPSFEAGSLPVNPTVCVGTSPKWRAKVNGFPEPRKIRWEESPTSFAGTWKSIGFDPPRQVTVEQNDGKFYRVVYANDCDTAYSSVIQLTVDNFQAEISGGGSFCPGANVTLRIVEPSNIEDRDIKVRWEVERGAGAGFETLPGEEDITLTLNDVDVSIDDWRYRVVLTSQENCVAESLIEVINVFPQLEFTRQPQSQEVCVGEPVELNVDFPNSQPTVIEWQWRRDGETEWSVAVGSGNSKRFRINETESRHDGRRIRVAVYHCNDTSYTDEVVLRVIHAGLLEFTRGDTVDLGRIETCNLSALQTLEIRNNAPVEMRLVNLFSTDLGLNLVSTEPNPIPPGQTAIVSISYAPFAAGLVDLAVSLQFDQCETNKSLRLLADVRGERPRLEPAAIDFGVVPDCAAAVTRIIEIVAPQDNSLALHSVELPAPFLTNLDLSTPIEVDAGQRLEVPLILRPDATGPISATVKLEYIASNCNDANVLEATLLADVQAAELAFTAPELEFELYECDLPYEASFEIRNLGVLDVPLMFGGEVQVKNPPANIRAGETRQIEFSIDEVEPGEPLQLVISNTLCELDETFTFLPQLLQIGPIGLPATLDFGSVRSGTPSTLPLTIINSGSAGIRLIQVDGSALGIEPTDPEDIPRVLAGGESFELSLTLLPDGLNGVGPLTLTFETPCGTLTQTLEVLSDQSESYELGFSAKSGFVDLGETVDLCFNLISSDGFGPLTDDFRLSFEFEYNATVAAPVDLSLETRRDAALAAIRIDTLLPAPQNELVCIPIISGWGNSSGTYFEIIDVSVTLASTGRKLEPLSWTQTPSGVMIIRGIAQHHLINPVPGVLSLNVVSTPIEIGDPLELKLRNVGEAGADLVVYDGLGRRIYRDRLSGNQTDLSLNLGITSPGVYFCQVSVGDFAITRAFVVN